MVEDTRFDFLEDLLKGIEEQPTDTTDIFRPTSFDEFVGQEDTKKLLNIAIQAALLENRPLPNMLLAGGFGLGKSALAKIIIDESNKIAKITDGSTANKNVPDSGTYIIDEIHNLTPEVCDTLSLKMDNGTIHLIGCTTDPGQLPAPFRSRFRLFHLRNYSEDDLAEIAARVCARKGVTADKTILNFIATRSRFNARQVITYLSIIFDLMAVRKLKVVEEGLIKEAFALLGVDENGYLERDREYVAAMPFRPVGLGWLSSVLGIDKTTIEDEIEPYLMQTGVIDRTPKGRVKLREIKVDLSTTLYAAEESSRFSNLEELGQHFR